MPASKIAPVSIIFVIAPPQIAQFLWIGGALSVMEQLCLRSFLDHDYEVHLYTYGEVSGIPAGVRLMDGNEIIPRTRIFANGKGFGQGGYAGFADLFRYHLLYQRGGWWFDMDFVSIKRLPLPDHLWIASSFEGGWGDCANSCAIHAPPGHPVLARLCEESEKAVQAGDLYFGQIGPYLVQRIVRELALQSHVAPWWEFSPYPHTQISLTAYQGNLAWIKNLLRHTKYFSRQCLRSDFRAGYLRSGTRAVHLHNECWRAANRDKNARFHPACLYERLKRRHGMTTPVPKASAIR